MELLICKMIEKYEDFCKESRCVTYNGISRLMSIHEPSESIKKDIEIIKVGCRQNCQRTAYDLCEWLKEKDLAKLR